jgi:AcrR family transcriptional regulator
MMTVAELAAQAGVSTQTVYRRLNSLTPHFKNVLTEKRAGILYFKDLEASLEVLKLTPVEQFNTDVQQFNTNVEPFNTSTYDETEYLREQNRTLLSDLETERNHNRNLTERILTLSEELAVIAKNNQVLLGIEQTKKTNLLSRIFGGRRKEQ